MSRQFFETFFLSNDTVFSSSNILTFFYRSEEKNIKIHKNKDYICRKIKTII